MKTLQNPWFWVSVVLVAVNVVVGAKLGQSPVNLEIEHVSPYGNEVTHDPVNVIFNLPMIPKERVGQAITEGVSLQPSVPGVFVWKNQRTIVFQGESSLPRGTEFTLTVDNSIQSRDGKVLASPMVHKFTTKAAKLVTIRQDSFEDSGDCQLSLKFDTTISDKDLKKVLTFPAAERDLDYEVITEGAHRIHTVKIKAGSEESLTIAIAPGLKCTEGSVASRKGVQKLVVLKRYFEITGISPQTDTDETYLKIHSNQRIDSANLKDKITIEPAVDFYVRNCWSSRKDVVGKFKPLRSYRITVHKGLQTTSGKILGHDVVRTVSFPSYKPTVKFKSSGFYLSSTGSKKVPMEAVNCDTANIRLYRIYPNNVIHFLREEESSWDRIRSHYDLSLKPIKMKVQFNGKANEWQLSSLDMSKTFREHGAGAYVAEASAPQVSRTTRKLLFLTDLGITAKRGHDELLVSVNQLSSGEPVGQTEVTVYSRENQALITAQTDQHGLIHFKDMNDEMEPYAVVASHADDVSVLKLNDGYLSETEFDVSGRPRLVSGYQAFVFTERDIYRPGETVHLQALVRTVDQALTEQFPLMITFYRPDGRKWQTKQALISVAGEASLDLPIPSTARIGSYRITVSVPGDDKIIGTSMFSVEDFAPDRIRARIDCRKTAYSLGEKFQMIVRSEYLFGSPVIKQKVAAWWQLSKKPFAPREYKTYDFCNDQASSYFPGKNLGDRKTDSDGRGFFRVTLPEKKHVGSQLELTLCATVTPRTGRSTSTSHRVIVHPYPYYVGIKQVAEEKSGTRTYDWVALDHTEKPFAIDQPLQAKLFAVTWRWITKLDENGRYHYKTVREEQCVSQQTLAGNTKGKFHIQIPGEGEYRLLLTSPGRASTDTEFWSGAGAADSWSRQRPDHLAIKLDKATYLPGDEATVHIQSAINGYGVFTLEGDGIREAIPFRIKDNSHSLKVKVPAGTSGDLYCCATVIQGNQHSGALANFRAYGVVPLRLDVTEHQLEVKFTAPQKVRPKQKQEVELRVTRQEVPLAGADVTLFLVDEGICRLTAQKLPDPFDFFYSKRRHEVKSYDVFSMLMPEMETIRKGIVSAAGGGSAIADASLLSPVRNKRFENAIIWKKSLRTDMAGRIKILLDIPDYTGELRVMAVAAKGRDFGSTQSAIKVKQPLLLETALPRALAPGDQFEVPMTVFNQTGNDGDVTIAIDDNGKFSVGEQAPTKLTIPDGENRMAFLTLKAPQEPGSYSLILTAQLGQEKATRRFSLPVRPGQPFTTLTGSGSFGADKEGTLLIPGNWLKGTEGLSLTFSDQPNVNLRKSLDYLLDYPYGCVEQTTSRSFPLLYVADLAMLSKKSFGSEQQVRDLVQHGIDRALTMQTYNGGFAYWPEGMNPYPWGSAYATHFLVEAKRAGYTVPQAPLTNALNYMEYLLRNPKTFNRHELATRAYAVYVLALAKRPNRTWLSSLNQQRVAMPLSAKCHLAGAMMLTNGRLDKALLEDAFGAPCEQLDLNDSLASRVRDRSLLLSTYLDLDPDHENVQTLVQELERKLNYGNYSTHECAFATMALGKYSHRFAADKKPFNAQLVVNGKMIGSLQSGKQLVLRQSSLLNTPIQVKVSGRGRVFYYWQSTGVPLGPAPEEKHQGMIARRAFLNQDGTSVEDSQFVRGKLYTVRITTVCKEYIPNVVISDLLPAGLEIENTRLQTREKHDPLYSTLRPDRVEPRDDRLLWFGTVRKGVHSYHYLVRATTAGTFNAPPIRAECMYDSDLFSSGPAGQITIK